MEEHNPHNATPMDRDPMMHGEEAAQIREAGREAAEAARDDALGDFVEMHIEQLEDAVPQAMVRCMHAGKRYRMAIPYETFEERHFDRIREAGFVVAEVRSEHKIIVKRDLS